MFKKITLGLGIVIALGTVILVARQWYLEDQWGKLVENQLELVQKDFPKTRIRQRKVGGNHEVLISPAKTTKALLKLLEPAQKTSSQQMSITRVVKQSSSLEGIHRLQALRTSYRKGILDWRMIGTLKGEAYDVARDGTLLSLGQLLAKGEWHAFHAYVDSRLTAVRQSEKAGLLATLTPKMTDFHYAKRTLRLGNVLELSLEEIQEWIDPQLLSQEDLSYYDRYRLEKEEKEKAKLLVDEQLAQWRQRSTIADQPAPVSEKLVALTFDDGPRAETTPQVLDLLDKYQAKGTFFVLGSAVAGNEDVLKRMVASGHEVANHTWDHPKLTSLPPEQIKNQISRTDQVLQAVAGVKPRFMRPPYGATNPTVPAWAGLTQVMWSLDTKDWQSRQTEAILAKVKAELKPGSVILMHDIHSSTVEALSAVLDYLTTEGYRCVTVSDLYQYPD